MKISLRTCWYNFFLGGSLTVGFCVRTQGSAADGKSCCRTAKVQFGAYHLVENGVRP